MLKGTLTRYKVRLQGELFPVLRETFGALSSKQEQLVTVLGLVAVESFLPHYHGVVGRPEAERAALASAFIAKAVYNSHADHALRYIKIRSINALPEMRRRATHPQRLQSAENPYIQPETHRLQENCTTL